MDLKLFFIKMNVFLFLFSVLALAVTGLVGVLAGIEPSLESSVKQDTAQDKIQDEILQVKRRKGRDRQGRTGQGTGHCW